RHSTASRYFLFSICREYPPISPCTFVPVRTPTPLIHPLSLHDALPISAYARFIVQRSLFPKFLAMYLPVLQSLKFGHPLLVEKPDRKSTRLNSSHQIISYAVFCLKKKKMSKTPTRRSRWIIQKLTSFRC